MSFLMTPHQFLKKKLFEKQREGERLTAGELFAGLLHNVHNG